MVATSKNTCRRLMGVDIIGTAPVLTLSGLKPDIRTATVALRPWTVALRLVRPTRGGFAREPPVHLPRLFELLVHVILFLWRAPSGPGISELLKSVDPPQRVLSRRAVADRQVPDDHPDRIGESLRIAGIQWK